MKIETNGSERIDRSQYENTQPVEPSRISAEDRAKLEGLGKDEAALSDKARSLVKAREELSEVQDVRTDRVEELKSQIQANEYTVPYEELARRLKQQFE